MNKKDSPDSLRRNLFPDRGDEKVKFLKKMLAYLCSPAFALFILVLFLVVLIVGVNPWFKIQSEGPQGFYRSWIFIAVTVLMFVALLACTARQVARLSRSKRQGGPWLHEFEICREADIDGLKGNIIAFIKTKGFREQSKSDSEITCVKKKYGIWGSVVFHAGLILVCCGIFIELGYAFSGRVGMVAGQSFEDRLESYNYTKFGPLHRHEGGAFTVYLHGIRMKYKDTGVFTTADTSFIIDGTELSRQDIAPGNPLRYRSWNIALEIFGYYVKTLIKFDGREYPLDIGLSTHSNGEIYTELFDLKDTPYRIQIQLIPDVDLEGKSFKPDRPAVQLDVRKTEKGENSQVYRGTVPLGGSADFEPGSGLQFTGFYPWVALEAKLEPGLYIIYAGFVISLLGLVLLYLWVPEYIHLKFTGEGLRSKVVIGGYKPRYRQEFQLYLADIHKELVEFLSKEDFHGPVA